MDAADALVRLCWLRRDDFGVPGRSAFKGCAAYTEADVETSIGIAAAGGLPASEIISGIYELEQAADAFADATADRSGKLLISASA